ncbi:hypothetical protein ASPTUDRAFT_51283 [Aspergillus tubingensis CBS 134.48]|uniref:Uncharacterized protein n=1 Tax=Aspergillus tubingensis (strain CBS 134.48) TaxID=767770 RepID=A0A1L9NGS8_ASPTC|nr:hypothetical protein ASPTUDRAFT_51283 [Aspergillus tubingensis CBS 134.48]
MAIVQGADPLQSLLLVLTQSLTKCLLESGLLVVLRWRKQAGIYPEACTHEAYIQPVDAVTELITALAPCTYSKRFEYMYAYYYWVIPAFWVIKRHAKATYGVRHGPSTWDCM